MELCNLPIEVFRIVLAEMAAAVGIFRAVRLRLICRRFNLELYNAICSTALFEEEYDAASVNPGTGLPKEYIFRLTCHPSKRSRELPSVVRWAVAYLLTLIKDEDDPQRIQYNYTRALCGAAADYIYRKTFQPYRYPLAPNDSSASHHHLKFADVHVSAAAAFLGCDKYFEDLPLQAIGSSHLSKYFGSPLVLAAKQNHYNIVKTLLERYGCEYGASTREQALRAAARHGHKDVVQLILEPKHVQGDLEELYGKAVLGAIKGGHACFARALTKRGGLKVSLERQLRIFEVAAQQGHEDIVREALENGLSTDSDGLRRSPLLEAVKKGHTKIVQLLISQGAGVEKDRALALHFAAQRGYWDMTKILLDHGFDINGDGFYIPLSAAASHGQYDMFHFLVKAGADVSYLKGNYGFFLRTAALHGHYSMIRILISYGMDVKNDGEQAVLHAMMGGHDNVIKMLLDLGAKRPHRSVVEHHLHKSIQQGNEDWALNLIAHGADMNAIRSIVPLTPLDAAQKVYYLPHLSKALIKLGARNRASLNDPMPAP